MGSWGKASLESDEASPYVPYGKCVESKQTSRINGVFWMLLRGVIVKQSGKEELIELVRKIMNSVDSEL